MPSLLDCVREGLLRAGVAPRYANRYVAELNDHLSDLAEEQLAAGLSMADATLQANQRLGSVEGLVCAMTAQRRFVAWSAKAPVTSYVFIPTVLFTIGLVLSAAVIVEMRRLAGPLPGWFGSFTALVVCFATVLAPTLVAWSMSANARKQRMGVAWPALGLILLALASSVFSLSIAASAKAGAHGEVSIGLVDLYGASGLHACVLHFMFSGAATVLPYVMFGKWRSHVGQLFPDDQQTSALS